MEGLHHKMPQQLEAETDDVPVAIAGGSTGPRKRSPKAMYNAYQYAAYFKIAAALLNVWSS
jgi:hypothetical protein